MVFRSLNGLVGKVDDHGAIYIGHANKAELPTNLLSHKLIQMTGIRDGGFEYLAMWRDDDGFHVGPRVTDVGLIEFDNFDSFQKSHPHYYGAFTLASGLSFGARAQILKTAQALKNRGIYDEADKIGYVVMPGESAMPLIWRYFTTKNDLSTYGDIIEISDILRMRSDAFVEYAYAAAGVPIARNPIGQPLNLTKKNDAVALVWMAADMKLYPDMQKDWMTASQTDNPTIGIKDSKGGSNLNAISAGLATITITDASSGPGLLKIHKEPYQAVYGREDLTPYEVALVDKGQILAANIMGSTDVVVSPGAGLGAGFYTATAYDNAGNHSVLSFAVSGAPAFRADSVSPLYDNFSGVSTLNPSTVEREHTFSFSDGIAGVSSVLMTGPPGDVINWAFNPPVNSTGTELADMSPGQYSVKIINSVGSETNASFNIGLLNVKISTPSSSQNINYASDPLGPSTVNATINAKVESDTELDRIELTDTQGRVIETIPSSLIETFSKS